jgi:YD repeat-containing protein
VSLTLDPDGRVSRETVNGSDHLDFKYDPAGNLTGVGALSLVRDPESGLVTHTATGVVETSQQFDANNQLVRVTTTAAGTWLLDQRYTRDALGRINSVEETGTEGKRITTEYSYDRGGRLEFVRVNGRTIESDSYDPPGNRIGVVRRDQKLAAAFDDRNRLTTFGEATFSWTPEGTLTNLADRNGSVSFSYDDFGTLRSVKLRDGREIQYLVDADGRRVGRRVAGRLVAGYLYQTDGAIAAEVDGVGKLVSQLA